MARNIALLLVLLAVLFLSRLWFSPPPPPPPTAKIDPLPATIDFGDVYVGQTGTGSTTWNNTTAAPAVMVSAGTADANFGFNNATFTAGNLPVGGNSGALQFTFSPSAAQAYTGKGQLVVTGNRTSKVDLKGNGVYKKTKGGLTLVLSIPAGAAAGTPPPAFVDFHGVKVGNTGTVAVTIVNGTPNPVNVTAAWSAGGQGFAVANPPGNTFAVPPGGTAVNLTFTPAAIAHYTDAVTFSDAAGNIFCGVVTQGDGTE